jgi:acetyl/propionyl-CoA carboxylase alpha subunit
MIQRIRISHDGNDIEVPAEKLQGKVWFHLNGETCVFEPASIQKTKTAAALNPNLIEAPMPGKILRVEVKVGASVQPGTVLIVMEAMKMEYTLAAAGSMTVTDVTCKVGDQVRLGQILVRLKEEKNG